MRESKYNLLIFLLLNLVFFSCGSQTKKNEIEAVKISFLSSKSESEAVKEIFKIIPSTEKIQFIPLVAGEHGSKVLWKAKPASTAYWDALKPFLQKVSKLK